MIDWAKYIATSVFICLFNYFNMSAWTMFHAWQQIAFRYNVMRLIRVKTIWAATWQNQQNGCAPSEDSDQPGHPPRLIRVFAVRMKKAWVLSYPLSAQRRRWSDWADAQADLSLRWAHSHFVGFVMSRLICGLEKACLTVQFLWCMVPFYYVW